MLWAGHVARTKFGTSTGMGSLCVPSRWWQDYLKSFERARPRETLVSIKNGEPELNTIEYPT